MKVLTVSEEDMGCSVPWILRVPEVIDQSFNRLKKQYGNVTVTFICLLSGISQVFDKTMNTDCRYCFIELKPAAQERDHVPRLRV